MGVAFAFNFLRFLLWGFEVLILGRVLVSWVDPAGRTTAGAFLIQITEPVLGPVRRLLPRTGMLDLSPLIVLIVLGTILRQLP